MNDLDDHQRDDPKCEGCTRKNGVSPAPTFSGELDGSIKA